MTWESTLNLSVPGYNNITCHELFVTPFHNIAGIGVSNLDVPAYHRFELPYTLKFFFR